MDNRRGFFWKLTGTYLPTRLQLQCQLSQLQPIFGYGRTLSTVALVISPFLHESIWVMCSGITRSLGDPGESRSSPKTVTHKDDCYFGCHDEQTKVSKTWEILRENASESGVECLKGQWMKL